MLSAPSVSDRGEVAAALRCAGARFGFAFGSRSRTAAGHVTTHPAPRQQSDLDVAAYWGCSNPPQSWEVEVPAGTDLVVLDRAPLWLAGRIALRGELLFDDDPPARAAWQADTAMRWNDERPLILQSQAEFRDAVARGRR